MCFYRFFASLQYILRSRMYVCFLFGLMGLMPRFSRSSGHELLHEFRYERKYEIGHERNHEIWYELGYESEVQVSIRLQCSTKPYLCAHRLPIERSGSVEVPIPHRESLTDTKERPLQTQIQLSRHDVPPLRITPL